MTAVENDTELLSVSTAMAKAKRSLESFAVKLVGEVSEVNNKPGYKAVYFTVKDDKASLPCMMWVNRYDSAGIDMRVGMLVELTGRFTLFAPKGRMNFDVFSLTAAGEGDLRLRVANLAKKLQAEGLMNPERKRPIPRFPERIGLVTSPRGAAIHDVLRTLRRRFPLSEVKVAGVPVEGEKAVAGIVEALHCVEAADCDVVLLVRGGGSFEDLMPFNDELLARTIAGLHMPVITGIGHEPDTSIADMIADLRASTPTAAAEAATPAPEAIESYLESAKSTFLHQVQRRIEKNRSLVEQIEQRPLFKDANRLVAQDAQGLDFLEERLSRAIPVSLERDARKLDLTDIRFMNIGRNILNPFTSGLSFSASRLHDLSPLIVLSRGYSIARDDQGRVLKSISQTSVGKSIEVDLHEGRLFCRVEDIEETAIVSLEE